MVAEDHAEQHLGALGPRSTRGSLNSGTPLAMASTPVSALQPGGEGLQDEEDGDGLETGGRRLGDWPG